MVYMVTHWSTVISPNQNYGAAEIWCPVLIYYLGCLAKQSLQDLISSPNMNQFKHLQAKARLWCVSSGRKKQVNSFFLFIHSALYLDSNSVMYVQLACSCWELQTDQSNTASLFSLSHVSEICTECSFVSLKNVWMSLENMSSYGALKSQSTEHKVPIPWMSILGLWCCLSCVESLPDSLYS